MDDEIILSVDILEVPLIPKYNLHYINGHVIRYIS